MDTIDTEDIFSSGPLLCNGRMEYSHYPFQVGEMAEWTKASDC